MSSNIDNYSTHNNEHNCEDLCINKHALWITITTSGVVQFSIVYRSHIVSLANHYLTIYVCFAF